MKAMVLPKKQLLYILEKQGFKLIGEDFIKKSSGRGHDILFLNEMLEFCGETINIEMTDESIFFHFRGERYYWNKDWFVPNTLPRVNLRKALKNEKTFYVNIYKDKTLSAEIQHIAHQEGVFFKGSFNKIINKIIDKISNKIIDKIIIDYGHSLIFEFDKETEKYHIFVACDEKTIIEYDVEYIPTTDSFNIL
jgi:hypothetical protein